MGKRRALGRPQYKYNPQWGHVYTDCQHRVTFARDVQVKRRVTEVHQGFLHSLYYPTSCAEEYYFYFMCQKALLFPSQAFTPACCHQLHMQCASTKPTTFTMARTVHAVMEELSFGIDKWNNKHTINFTTARLCS